jgi:SH3-like domain-containing protein
MRKLLYLALFTTVSFSTFAADTKAPAAKPVAQKSEEAMILLYDSPSDKAKPIKQLSPTADLVAVYRHGDWVKVGDRADGTTGWINAKQYQQARNDYYQHYFQNHVQSFYMSTVKDKDGKTVVEAYQNGKKLSDVEAKKLYGQMQQQEKQQLQMMQHFDMEMHHAFNTVFYPGIVVVQPVVQEAPSPKPVKK